MNCKDVDICYRKMLSTWLKIDPQPSWDDLLTALEHVTVQCGDLADSIRKKYGIPKQSAATSMELSPVSAATQGTYVRKTAVLTIFLTHSR